MWRARVIAYKEAFKSGIITRQRNTERMCQEYDTGGTRHRIRRVSYRRNDEYF